MEEPLKKASERNRKARQRLKRVFCDCSLCKGGQEVTPFVASKHLKLFGGTGTSAENTPSTSSSSSSGSDNELTFRENTSTHDRPVHNHDENCNMVPVDCVSNYDYVDNHEVEEQFDASPSGDHDHETYEVVLYDSCRAKMPLYSASNVTVLETLARYFQWFTEHPGVSKTSLSDLLCVQNQYVLPLHNNLPRSYDEAFKFVEPFLLPLKVFHVCPNNCIVYRDSPRFQFQKLTECPVCGTPRYIGNSGRARKRFHYYPVGPRWKRMYGDSRIAEMLQSHGAPATDKDKMQDVQDSPQFQEAYKAGNYFNGDPRGLSVQFSTDGMNPFKHGTYSMWPLTLTVLNLPKHVRHLFTNIMLVGIIPGQKGDAAFKIDPYVEVLVDELLEFSVGIPMYDGYRNEKFNLKVKILNHVLDYPGLNKLFSATGANALKGCLWCDVKGRYISTLDKTVYLENRRYLPKDSDLRLDKTNFPDKFAEKKPPPCRKDFVDILYNSVACESAPNSSQAKNISKGSGCKSCYSLMLLENHDRTKQAFPDVMHAMKNVVVGFIDLITGREDTIKVRRTEAELKRFPGCHSERDSATTPVKGHGSTVTGNKNKMNNAKKNLPDAPFRLTKDELKKADQRSSEICVPSGFGWRPATFFSNYSGMKAHDWKEVATQGIIKYCLRDALGLDQRKTFFRLLDTLTNLTAEEQSKDGIKSLRDEVNTVCALVERDFPISLQVVSLHILRHIVDGIEHYGPTHSWSMWMYERFNSWISRRVMNRTCPEATILRTYQIFDWCQYMKMSGRITSVDTNTTSMASEIDQESESEDEAEIPATSTTTIPQNVLILLKELYSANIGVDEESCNIPNDMLSYNRHTEKVLGRKVIWAGESIETVNHYRVSSVISLRMQLVKPLFGQIMYFFSHVFQGTSNKFAVIRTFDSKFTTLEKESDLWWINTSHTSIRVVPASARWFSKPLVTAKCSTRPNTLCILNNTVTTL